MTARGRPRSPGPATRHRVVLDTNVVISALVFGKGATAALRLAWRAARFVPLVSTPTVQELVRVLAYLKFRLSAGDQHELLADYLPFADVVRNPTRLPKVPACRDAFDLPFLHLAAVGCADALVTGDADLLVLAGQGTCQILTPDAFLADLPQPAATK